MTATWTGATNTDWSTASNWSPATVPTNTENVYVPPEPGNSPVVSENRSVNDLTVGVGASVTIGSGVTISAVGDVDAFGLIVGYGGTLRMTGAGSTLRGNVPILDVSSATGGLTLSGAVTASRLYSHPGGTAPTISGGGNLLTAEDLDVDVATGTALTLDGVLLTYETAAATAPTAFNDVTFGTYATTAVQFTIKHAGSVSPWTTFSNIQFNTTPGAGLWLDARDTVSDANTLTLTISSRRTPVAPVTPR